MKQSRPVIFTKQFENGSAGKTWVMVLEKEQSFLSSNVFEQFISFVLYKLCIGVWYSIWLYIIKKAGKVST